MRISDADVEVLGRRDVGDQAGVKNIGLFVRLVFISVDG